MNDNIPPTTTADLILRLTNPGLDTRDGRRRATADARLIYDGADGVGPVESRKFSVTSGRLAVVVAQVVADGEGDRAMSVFKGRAMSQRLWTPHPHPGINPRAMRAKTAEAAWEFRHTTLPRRPSRRHIPDDDISTRHVLNRELVATQQRKTDQRIDVHGIDGHTAEPLPASWEAHRSSEGASPRTFGSPPVK